MLPKNDLARSLLIAVVGMLIVGTYFYTPGTVKVQETEHAVFDNAAALEEAADLVIVAEPLGNIEDYESIIVRDEAGNAQDFYTVFDVQPTKTLKGEAPGDVVKVLQNAILVPSSLKSKPDFLVKTDVTPLEKGQRYLLFLEQGEVPGVYEVVALNQGKFSLDDRDEKELEMEADNAQFKSLKQDVLSRYSGQLGN